MMSKFLPRVLLLALCALLSLAATAAQTPSQTPPKFAFVESDAIVLAPGSTPVATVLQNHTADKVDVWVEVISVDPKDPRPILLAVDFKPFSVTLPAAGSVVIKVDPPTKADAEFGEGYLIAIENGKAFARRQISGRHPLPATPPPQADPKIVEPSAALDSFETVNLPGINFFPSFTTRHSSTSTLIVLILIFLSVIWLWKCVSGRSSTSRQLAAGVVLAGLVILLALMLNFGWWQKNLPSRVIVPPVSITSKPPKSGVISDDGSLGKLESDGAQLKASGIPRAGAYKGALKVPGSNPEKEVKVVTNVSDWWPYALLMITLGVLLGYYLTRYFNQQRGEDQQRVRAARTWLRVSEDESGFQLSYGGQPFAGYSIALMVKVWLSKIEGLLTAHDTNGAKTSLDRLEAYVNLFVQFRGQLLALKSVRERVLAAIEQSELELALDSVFSQAGQALNGQPLVSSTDEEQNGTALKSYQAQVQSYYVWLTNLEKTLEIIARYSAAAEGIDTQGWAPEMLAKLKEQQDNLVTLKRDAIRATQAAAVKEAENAATVAYKKILQLSQTAGLEGATLDFMSGMVAADDATGTPDTQSLQVSTLSDSVLAPRANGSDPDDLHLFTATATVPAVPQTYQLQWDFADGTTSEIPAASLKPGEQVQLSVSHRFNKGGIYEVSIKNGAGEILKTLDVPVDEKPGRAERLLLAFRMTEWQMSVISGLLAAGLGFYTLYLKEEVWGTPADYLYALLWGSVVSEGLKYAAGLAERIWKV